MTFLKAGLGASFFLPGVKSLMFKRRLATIKLLTGMKLGNIKGAVV